MNDRVDGLGNGLPLTDQLTPELRWRGLAAVMVSAVIVGLTIGMTIPLIALTMTAAGTGAAMVGVNAAMPALAILIVAPLVPRLIGWLGLVSALTLGCLVSAASLALFPVSLSLVAWFGLRLTMGVGLALLWVVSETWLTRLATPPNRGRIVGLYATLWSAGLASGPLALQVTGIAGPLPFLVTALLVLAAAVPPVLARKAAPGRFAAAPPPRWSWALVGVAPVTILAGFTAGFGETSLLTLLPIYGEAGGLDRSQAVLMLSAFAGGSLVCQIPLGWLADRFGSQRVLAAAAILAILAAASLAAAVTKPLVLWPLLMLWGGVVPGFYTLGLAQLARHFPPVSLPHANVMFIMAYTIGTISGPIAGGSAQNLWPLWGLPLACGLVYVLYLAGALANWHQKKRLHQPSG